MEGYGEATKGQLLARPGIIENTRLAPVGLQALGIDDLRDALLYVPPDYSPDQPPALAVLLHGAGGRAENGVNLLQPLADSANLILLAISSMSYSWDVIAYNKFGPDVALLDKALAKTFEDYAIDSSRLAVAGFSDGATYALSVGLTNGDLFTHILAFSPGYYHAPVRKGKPRIYISHGIQDSVLPINMCSRMVVPLLKKRGYEVYYHEFEGGHSVPPAISQEAIAWFTAGRGDLAPTENQT
jgi:predicted esterase